MITKPKTFLQKDLKKRNKGDRGGDIKSPSINRIIAERTSLGTQIDTPVLVSFLSGIVLLGIIVISLLLLTDFTALKIAANVRVKKEKELGYWTALIMKYPDYRDAYLKESAVAASLGKSALSQEAYAKAFTIDPNSK